MRELTGREHWHTSARGFSVIELIICVGIVMIFLSAATDLTTVSFNRWNGILKSSKNNSIVDEIRNALASEGTCSRNLQGKDAAMNGPHSVVPVAGLDYFDDSGNKERNLVTVDPNARNGAVGIEIRTRTAISASELLGDLVVSMIMPGTTSTVIRRELPILLTVSGGKITTCRTAVPAEEILMEKSCELGGQGNNTWDPITHKCVYTGPVTKVRGTTPFVATCPEGWVLPDNHQVSCGHSDFPPGLVDPAPKLTRTYGDGSVRSSPPRPVICAPVDPKTCGCIYAVELDPNGMFAEAECIPE